MTMTQIPRLPDKYRPLFLGLLLLLSFSIHGQTYNPSTCCTVSNKAYGAAQAVSTDGRSWFYDATNFVMRDYNGTTEVFSYLNLPKYRSGHFPIFVHTGGILQGNGVWLGGATLVYWFKDSTGNANLVRWYTDSTGVVGGPFYAVANNLSEGNAGLIKGNLALDLVNNTSDAQKNAASVSLTNHTISGSLNTLTNIPNSALVNNSVGLTINSAAGSDISVTTTPAALGSSLVANIPSANGSSRGALTPTDWNTFNNKQSTLTLTVAGFSGPATLVGTVLNIPQYTAGTGCLSCNADSLKHLPVDTSSNRNGYALTFDSTNHKWALAPNGSGTGITQLTSDVLAGPGSGSQVATLATVNSNVGTFGSASTVYQATVNAKGLTTAAAALAIQISESQVTNLITDLSNKLSTLLPSADIFVGNGSNIATAVSPSGDWTIANTGVNVVGNNKITYAKMQAAPSQGLIGAPSAGNYQHITLGAGLSISGGALIAAVASIPPNLGSGFRWYAPQTPGFKTAFVGGYGLALDSTANTNGITTTLDTVTKIAPRHIVSDSLNYALLNAVNVIDTINTLNTNNYQNDSLKTSSIINVFVDNLLIPSKNINGNTFWTFDGATGTLIFNNGLLDTASDLRIVYKRLPYYTTYPIFNIVIDGNSIPNGAQTSAPSINGLASIFANTMGKGFPFQRMFVNNKSVGNQTLDTIIAGQTDPQSKISRYADTIRPLIQVGKRNVLLIWEEVNQLYYGMSIGRYETKLQQYCNTARADGWEVLVISQTARDTSTNHGFFNTPGPSDDTYGMNIIQATDTINVWMRANWPNFANGIIDLASLPIFQNYPDSNTTYHYSFDGIHYSDYGSYVAGNYSVGALLGYMNEPAPNPYYVVSNNTVLTAYLSAANITNSTQVAAVTQLFRSLSQTGLWQYIDQLYPILGDNGTSYEINAKSPANFILNPINPGGGGDVLSYSSALGLTTSGNARVEVPRKDSSLLVTSYGIFVYTNLATGGSTPYIFGDGNFLGRYNGASYDAETFNGTNTFSQAMNFPPYTGVDAYYSGRNIVNQVGCVRNAATQAIDAPAGLTWTFLNTTNIPFGCYYFNATPTIFPATVPVRFATIAITKGLPPNKVQQLSSIVNTYNSTLGRSYLQVH